MRLDPAIKMELERVKLDVDSLLPKLGKSKIRELKGVIEKHYKSRYKLRHRIPKYGSLNKGFLKESCEPSSLLLRMTSTSFFSALWLISD